MKKLIAGAVAGAALFANVIPALAAPMPKVELCHTTDSFDVLANEWTLVVGHRVNVSENALLAHQAHGDFVSVAGDNNDIGFGPVLGPLTWGQVATNLGLSLAGVECAGFVLDF